MKRCKICLMPDTRPGIKFNENGICYPCLNYEKSFTTNWFDRWDELGNLCDNFRKEGKYDCLMTLSGGKDSHFQVYIFKHLLGMNPLGFMIDNASWTNTGRENFYNISEKFGMDIITFTPNRKLIKERAKKGFVEKCHPSAYWDEILYKVPFEMADRLGIDLLIWGENTSYETGGIFWKETPDAHILLKDPKKFPHITSVFTSYYVPWDRYNNLSVAKKFGFKDLNDTNEWIRLGMEEFPFEQVDTIGYFTNQYCKFIKFGFSTITELCSDAVRHGHMTRETGFDMVKKKDWQLDPKMLKDFCMGLDISEKFFWDIIDSFANKNILEKREDGWWHVKDEM